MRAVAVTHSHPLAGLDPNRADAFGAALSAILPIAALIIVNGTLSAFALDSVASARQDLPFAVPHWVASVIWLMIYPMWGMARWTAWQSGSKGREVSRSLVALMAAGIAMPLLTPHLDLFFTVAAETALLLFALVTAARLFAVSKSAFAWMVPSLAWLGFGGVVGFATIAQGWTPPFALTDNAGSPV